MLADYVIPRNKKHRYFLGTIADNLSAIIEFTPIYKNKSVKLPFETKDSTHLAGKSGDDSSALIEFTPL